MSEWVFGTAIRLEDGDHVVTVRDLPEVVTSGDDEAEALALAADAVEVSLAVRMKKDEALPERTPVQDGEHVIPMPSRVAAKASPMTRGARLASRRSSWRNA